MQKIFDGVTMLEGEVSGRPLQLMYLAGKSASILLDTGCDGDLEKFISPQIREAGGDPAQLTWIINTHPDLDHTGGNAAIKGIAPNARLACGDADREACSGFENLFRLRYDAYRENHQIFYDDDTRNSLKERHGHPQLVEVTFLGGEHIRLDNDWEIEIVALPGHAKGHLGVLDRKNAALYGGDAIHGRVYDGLDGTPKLPPTYLHVDDYLSTIHFIEHLPVTTYIGCHWPVKRDKDIAAFCNESRTFVEETDTYLKELLVKPHTLSEICRKLGPKLGEWPREADRELVFVLNGHLEKLLDEGQVSACIRQEKPRILEFQMIG